ncbi:hypothetical protein [Paraburkholderia phenazinium]|jgi:hypothetical protein|uniref:Uncharacterized protein n=1 Tax=Paraburkholderia phenazinium TaxID=60549 RepID=A0A1N6IMV9_9BURK|nr:hypothetical protein [Paraburkholderia phenazinium]SIO33316.1 hypothetical protein SAMN05444165_2305 [Paraburkholderia phenazinium]
MEQLTFGTCVRNSWISTWQAIVQMPGWFLGVFAVIACLTLLSGSFQYVPSGGAELDAAARASHALGSMVFSILQLVIYCCLTIKVHRFVLLGEGTQPLLPLGGKPLGRFALISVGLTLGIVVLSIALVLLVREIRSGGIVLVGAVVMLAYMFAMVRLSLLYPAVSLGGALTLRAAWKDSRGHFWSIFGVVFVSYLPLLIVWIILLEVLGPRMLLTSLQGASTVFAIGLAFVNTGFIVLAASALSWLYRRYANELLEHAAY